MEDVTKFYEQYDEHKRLVKTPFHLTEFLISKAIIKKYIKKYFDHKEIKILDIGGGTGRYSIWLAKTFPKAKIYLVDIVPKHIEISKEYIKKLGLEDRIEAKVGDVRNIDFSDGYFDVILCLGSVLNHLDKKEINRALKELRRVAKAKGLVFISIVGKYHRPFRYLINRPEEIERVLDEWRKDEKKHVIKLLFDPFKFKKKLEKYFKVLEISALEGYASGNLTKFNEVCKDRRVFRRWIKFLWETRRLKSAIYISEHVMYVCQKC